MLLRILPLLFLTIILPDLYIYCYHIRHLFVRRSFKWLYVLPSIFLITIAVALTTTEDLSPKNQNDIILFLTAYMLIALPKTQYMLLSLIGRGLSFVIPQLKKRVTPVCCILSFTTMGMLAYGLTFGPKRLIVKQVAFSHPQLPKAFNGYRIVQFTDLHLASFKDSPEQINSLVTRINALQPDMIVFTGDLVNTDVMELNNFVRPLSLLQAKDGVYSVLGNHDYEKYARYLSPQEQAKRLQLHKDIQEAMGWKLLLNDNHVIHRGNDSIVIVGVENDGKPPFPALGDLKKALASVPGYKTNAQKEIVYKILLSHDPTYWRRKVLPDTDIQLTLSGHTHGMQFMLFGWSPSQYIYPEWKGLYKQGNRGLYVSLGVGGALIPFRFGAWPEINEITLYNK